MILSNLNSFQLSHLNAIANVDIFEKFIAIMAGDTEVVIAWLDKFDEQNWTEIDLYGNVTCHSSIPEHLLEKQIASRPNFNKVQVSGIIDLDDEYMFEQMEE